MSIYSKIKIGIILISTVLILFVHLFERGFYRKPIFKKWGKLTWADFDGMVKPFIQSSARISFDIHIKYNEENREYSSYSVQNNIFSWKRKGVENDTLLLRHEQYHFNIAEYQSRLMNDYLKKNQPEVVSDFQKELEKRQELMGIMQQKYDRDTNHSRNVQQQEKWENKIDSLLGVKKKNRKDRLLRDSLYTKQWLSIDYSNGRIEEVEIYVSKNNDTISNQFKPLKNGEIDTLKSEFYSLKITETSKKNIHKGQITIYSKYNKLKADKRNRKTLEFHYWEQNIDSIWMSTKKSKNSNTIDFEFENVNGNRLQGFLYLSIERDTVRDNEDMIILFNLPLLVDNKVRTDNIFLEVFKKDSKFNPDNLKLEIE